MKRTLVAALALFTLATLGLAPRVEAVPVVSAGSATVDVGDIFTLPVSITDAIDLRSFQFDLAFDASILQVTQTGVTESTFFTQGDTTVFIPGIVDDFSGEILAVFDALVLQPSANGSGVLANIEFGAIAPGVSPLTLSNVFLNLSDSGFIVTNGEVCVDPGGVTTCAHDGGGAPEPGMVVLLAVGLALLTWGRWTRTR